MDLANRCRKCDKMGETIENLLAGCSSQSEAAYLGRYNQLAKTVHRQIAIKYKLLETNTPYYKYRPEPELESANVILY